MSTFATIIIDNNTQNDKNLFNDTMNKTYFVLVLQVWCKFMFCGKKKLYLESYKILQVCKLMLQMNNIWILKNRLRHPT